MPRAAPPGKQHQTPGPSSSGAASWFRFRPSAQLRQRCVGKAAQQSHLPSCARILLQIVPLDANRCQTDEITEEVIAVPSTFAIPCIILLPVFPNGEPIHLFTILRRSNLCATKVVKVGASTRKAFASRVPRSALPKYGARPSLRTTNFGTRIT